MELSFKTDWNRWRKRLGVSYVRNDMLALAAMLPVMEKGEDSLYLRMQAQKR